jgi:hypothetical protein
VIRVYIAHQLRGDWDGNIRRAREFAYAAMRRGVMPVLPYVLLDGMLDDDVPEEREHGIRLDILQLLACDEFWLCGPRVSEGMQAELREAVRAGLAVRAYATVDDVLSIPQTNPLTP